MARAPFLLAVLVAAAWTIGCGEPRGVDEGSDSVIQDTTPPATPTGLSAVAFASAIDLSWSASTDNVAVTGYRVYRNGVFLVATVAASATDSGLSASTEYCYTVTAVDAAGNESGQSASDCATTAAAGGDTTAPSIPTGLTATGDSASAVSLSWTASTDNVAVTAYRIYRNGAFLKTSAEIATSDSGLAASTEYCYAISAVDAAGNESEQSASDCATTQAAAGPATIVSGQDLILSLTAADGRIYWGNLYSDNATVPPTRTGTVRTASAPAWTSSVTSVDGDKMVSDSAALYYVTGTSLRKLLHGESVATTLYTAAYYSLDVLAVDADRLYVVENEALKTIPKSGGAASVLAATGVQKTVAVNATHVFYATTSAILRQPLGGGTAETVSTTSGVKTLVATNDAVFWTDGASYPNEKVYRLRFGGTAETVDSGATTAFLPLAADGQHAYWQRYNYMSPSTASIIRLGATGAAGQDVGNCAGLTLGAVALDETAIYWACIKPGTMGQGRVVRRPKAF